MEGLDQGTKDMVLDIGRRFPRLASWEMFAMTDVAISMFQNKVYTETAFIWESFRTVRSQTTLYSTPPDATKTVSQFIPSLKIKKLKAFAAGSSATPKIVTKTSKEVIPSKTASRPRHTAGTGQFCGAQNSCKIQCTIIKFYIYCSRIINSQ
jgi:hypothetical protein